MRRMKKAGAIFLAMSLTFGAAGCGRSSELSGHPESAVGSEQEGSVSGGGLADGQDAESADEKDSGAAAADTYEKVDPDSVSEAQSEDFTYEDLGGVIRITSYIGTADKVKVPEQIDGVPVQRIGEDAFRSNTEITYVYLPDTITYIGNRVFCNCSRLAEVRLPQGGMGEIPNSAFSGCSSLALIEIPEGVFSVGESAFEGCTSLKKAVLPSTLTHLYDGAFDTCSSLAEINLESVTVLTQLVFRDCTSLTSVSLSPDLTHIGGNTFLRCTSLKEIHLPEGNPNYTMEGGVIYEGDTAVTMACGAEQEEIVFREGTTQTEQNSFRENVHVKRIVIPDSMELIDRNAFCGCQSLESVSIGSGLKTLGQECFMDCPNLKTVTIKESGNEVTMIGNLFYGCRNLETINLPDSMDLFNDNRAEDMFRYCEKVKITYKGQTYTYDQLAELTEAIQK